MPTNNVFQLTLPDPWRETTIYTFEGPFDGGVRHNIVLTIDPSADKTMPLAEYAKQQSGSSKEALPGFELISEKSVGLPSGVPAYEIVYRYSPSDDVTLFQKQLFMLLEGKGYIFTSSFSKTTLQTIAGEVDRIIASFHPLKMEGGPQ